MRHSSPPADSALPRGSSLRGFFPLPYTALYLLVFAAVTLGHSTLLRLPYFWDEGGYYVPAALDFYHTGTLIPQFTNAHPPLPNVVLGVVWHLLGFHILVTRVTACAFAALGLTASILLGSRLLGPALGVALGVLTALYPIWFAQSSLAHADIFAAGFTLAALAALFTSPEMLRSGPHDGRSSVRRLAGTCALFCLAALSKETAIVQPVALAVALLVKSFRLRHDSQRGAAFRRWALPLALPIPVLALWFAFHFTRTGQVFGNPVYLHYNATDNFTLAHVLYALRIRFVHLFWQRMIWLPLVLAGACLFLPPEPDHDTRLLGLPRNVTLAILLLVVANLFAFSVLGGALLTRYLLPVYPLLLLVCLAVWRERTHLWLLFTCLTLVTFVPALWLNPSTFFAPEDNLTYRNMVVVQQEAIDFLNQHYPEATVLTAWPVSADLTRPELGYTTHPFRVSSLENFTVAELNKAAGDPGGYDTALVFTTHYASPTFRQFLLTHKNSWRSRHYAEDLDLTPEQIAYRLGGQVVWQTDRYGEWAAVLRFPRTYNAQIR